MKTGKCSKLFEDLIIKLVDELLFHEIDVARGRGGGGRAYAQ